MNIIFKLKLRRNQIETYFQKNNQVVVENWRKLNTMEIENFRSWTRADKTKKFKRAYELT